MEKQNGFILIQIIIMNFIMRVAFIQEAPFKVFDIDMSNSFANIIRYVCKKHKISTPEIEYYINHREECLSKFENRQEGKQAYISSAYSDKFRDKINIPEFKKFDKEMKEMI